MMMEMKPHNGHEYIIRGAPYGEYPFANTVEPENCLQRANCDDCL